MKTRTRKSDEGGTPSYCARCRRFSALRVAYRRAGGFEAFFVARVVPQGQQAVRGKHKGY
jgi:hypothetical protein